MQNPEMMKTAFDQLKANPSMLKNLSQMMGPNNPMSKYFENSTPE